MKPNERTTLVEFNLDWNSKLVIPSRLLSALDAILAECWVAKREYMDGSLECLTPGGPATMVTTTVSTHKHAVALGPEEAAEFKKWHDATRALQSESTYKFIMTIEEWRASPPPQVTE